MNKSSINEIAFELNTELIEAINKMNLEELQTKFGITGLIFEEIREELILSYGTIPKFKIFPEHIKLFEYNNEEGFGIEIALFTVNHIKTELTLHTELIRRPATGYQLRYRLIEVM